MSDAEEKAVKIISKGLQAIVESMQEMHNELKKLNEKFDMIVQLVVSAAAEEGIQLETNLEGEAAPTPVEIAGSLDG